MTDDRRLIQLYPRESVQLLSSISLGRVAFSARALPAIRPVSHFVDGDYVIIRADPGDSITSQLKDGGDAVVAYEADAIDHDQHLGWSVIVVGVARQVTEPAKATAYRQKIRSWASGPDDQVIAIHIDKISGFRLIPAPGKVVAGHAPGCPGG